MIMLVLHTHCAGHQGLFCGGRLPSAGKRGFEPHLSGSQQNKAAGVLTINK